jgi:flagellar hook-basal body complex protein FliE
VDAIRSAGARFGDVVAGPAAPAIRGQGGFGQMLTEALSDLARLETAADQAAQRVAIGDLAHLHEAVIAMQEASLALDLVVEVRNRLVDGVQELLRTQA